MTKRDKVELVAEVLADAVEAAWELDRWTSQEVVDLAEAGDVRLPLWLAPDVVAEARRLLAVEVAS